MQEEAFDVVIIGAGVIGHSIAFKLKQRDPQLNIAVLGDPMNSLMASRAAAGMLAPFCECQTGDRFFQFCRESLEKYPIFVQEVSALSGISIHLSHAGSVMPAKSLGDHWQERIEFFRQEKIHHEIWPVEKAKKKLPYLADDCGEVIWVAEGQVNNRQLHSALVAASSKLGVRVIPANATGFKHAGQNVQAVVTQAGLVKGTKIVLAAGSWSQPLGEELGLSLPLKPIKGQMCRVQVDEGRLDYTIHGIMTYVAPWGEGNGFVLGSTMEDRGFDPVVESEVIQGLIDRAAEILPCLKEAALIESWTGFRPAAEDLMPIMGASHRYENLFYSTGHYRNGILQTPNQADYLVSAILGESLEIVSEFDPARYDL